jgi:chromosome segregation ATPase
MSDLVSRLDTLKKEIEETKSRTISLKASSEKEEEILRDLVKEIKDLGFNPKTLKEDLDKMESDLVAKIDNKEKEVTEIKTVLDDIERNVKSHEVG